MAVVVFASKLQPDGSLSMPVEAAEELDVRPGDEVTVRAETRINADDQALLDQVAADLLKQAGKLRHQPGKHRAATDPNEAAIEELVKGKYRKQGFHL